MARPYAMSGFCLFCRKNQVGSAREAAGAMAWLPWLGCQGEAAVKAIVVEA
jgi:hypothetical protein